MENLPNCPKCNSEYTYEDGNLFICPECAHEWNAQSMAEKLNDMKISIGMKAGANGKIFGSVTPLQVAQALKNNGYDIDRRKIEVDEIKMLGTYEAIVNLHRDVAVKIAVEVIGE